jgi:hypothetical protein
MESKWRLIYHKTTQSFRRTLTSHTLPTPEIIIFHSTGTQFFTQLNMYGFRKVNRTKNSLIFRHDYFLRDNE